MKIEKTILKIISLFLIIGLNCSGIFGVGETMACFNDKEISENNIYTAGTLDFSLFSPHDNFVPKIKVENMKPGDEVSRMIQVLQEGNLPFKYTIRTEKISGDDNFCDALELKVKPEGEIKYLDVGGNSLMNFYLPEMEMINPPGIDTWQFKISLPRDASNDLQNKTCEFKFVFEGWQDNVENYEENGFDDVEEIENSFSFSGGQNSSWVRVGYPNGGEFWRIGQARNIQWTTGNFDNCNGELKIDIWYSANSGKVGSWANIVKNIEDNISHSYNWKVSLFLPKEGGGNYLTASAKARIKVVATCSNDSTITAWDMSDDDFCPPIEYDLLTPEEIEILESMGIFNDSNSTTGEEVENDDEEILEDNDDSEEAKNSEDLGPEIVEVEEVDNLDVADEESEDDDMDESETDDTADEDEDAKDAKDARKAS